MSGTCVLKTRAGREQHPVIYDIKSGVGFIMLLLSTCFSCLNTVAFNAKGSDFNSNSENV